MSTPKEIATKKLIAELDKTKKDWTAISKQLDAGADVDARNKLGETALKYALVENQKDILGQLHSLNASPNIPNNYGITALGRAAELTHIMNDKAEVKALLKHADKALKHDGEHTLSEIAAQPHLKNLDAALKAADTAPKSSATPDKPITVPITSTGTTDIGADTLVTMTPVTTDAAHH